MSDDELQITTADMLEIVADSDNVTEYPDMRGLIETAAKELREKDDEITHLRAENERLREALRDCVSALKHPIRPINNDGSLLNNIKFEVGRDMAVNAALRRARAILEGETK